MVHPVLGIKAAFIALGLGAALGATNGCFDSETEGLKCDQNSHCNSGQSCVDGKCAKASGAALTDDVDDDLEDDLEFVNEARPDAG